MASVFASNQPPKKLVRYGKSSTRTTYNTSHLDSFTRDDDELPTGKAVNISKSSLKDCYSVEKPNKKTQMMKRAQPKDRKPDSWDVPSSDDETTTISKSTMVPTAIPKSAIMNERQESAAPLAPWEVQQVVALEAEERRSLSHNERSVPIHIGGDLDRDHFQPEMYPTSSPRVTTNPILSTTRGAGSAFPSAAARLAARRGATQSSSINADNSGRSVFSLPKRARRDNDPIASTSRKRPRRIVLSKTDAKDVTLIESTATPKSADPEPIIAAMADVDIYDIPNSDAEEISKPKAALKNPTASATVSRRDKLKASSVRHTPRKSLSAPARLAEMLPADTDATDTTSPNLSTASASRPATPREESILFSHSRPATPCNMKKSIPDAAIKRSAALSPRQVELWSQLLPSDPVAPTPSALRMKELTLNGAQRSKGSSTSFKRDLVHSKCDVSNARRRRTRLVDRLKASTESSDDGSDMYDVDMAVNDNAQDTPDIMPSFRETTSEQDSTGPKEPPGSQTQRTIKLDSGLKVTYARTRSHLPEDSLEDALMVELPSNVPHRPAAAARRMAPPKAGSQQPAYDIEDSDEDTGTAHLRTIHELRAAGRMHSFNQDVNALMEDIANHQSTARSRRRSALIELATKLAEKSFAERFVAQGCEQKLISVCTTAPDDIADFALAAAMALILVAEPPEHTITVFKQKGVLDWLAGRLHQSVDIAKLASQRTQNLSKSAQESMHDFCDVLQAVPSLWSDTKPRAPSSRIVALKALDLLVGRLRRLGDKSELLNDHQLRLVMWTSTAEWASDVFECSLVVSVLESLSTSSMTLSWPEEVVDKVVQSLPQSDKVATMPTKTIFLALRLTLNLTNDNIANCERFATPKIIMHLLLSVEQGFGKLETAPPGEQRIIEMDLLVLAMVIVTSIAEHSAHGRELCVHSSAEPTLASLVVIFLTGQRRTLAAESVEEATFNIPFGYLAVMLANICQSGQASEIISSLLPGKKLDTLLAAVVEFITYHQTVDLMSLEGEEGVEVRSGFTERLKSVLVRLHAAAAGT